MAERLYFDTDTKNPTRSRKVIDGRRATDSNTDCCCGPGEDDWIDDQGPDFPGPNGPGPGPNPSDPDCCGCADPPNQTGCNNCWDADDDVDLLSGELAVERRVRVAARIQATVRLYAKRTDSGGATVAEYDETYTIDYIGDSYPGDGDEYCAADFSESDLITAEAVGSEEFSGLWNHELTWSTDNGFSSYGFSLEIGNDDAAWSGGFAATHRIDVAAASGSTISDGVMARAQTASGTNDATDAVTIALDGTCASREQQSFSSINASRRDPASGHPSIEVKTEIQSLSFDLVVGNVFACP